MINFRQMQLHQQYYSVTLRLVSLFYPETSPVDGNSNLNLPRTYILFPDFLAGWP